MANTTDYTRLLDGYALLAIKEYIKNNYAAKSHTHTKSQITDFPTSMPASDVYAWAKAATKPSYTYSEVGAAAAHHLYHTWDNNTNYYDSYEGGNMFRIITENMYADIFRFQASTVANLEYHNGSAWVAWSFDLSNLFDGNARTDVSIPYANRKFRFTMRTNGGWPTTGMFMLQGTWFNDGGWPSGQKSDIIIETRVNESASWTQRATFTLSGVEGMAGHTLSSLHTGETYYRITITIYPWTNTSNSCPLQRLCLFSNYNGGALEKITHDGYGNVTIPTLKSTTIYENGTSLANKYLGKTATAADSTKLNGQAASYYLNYNNLSNKPTIPSVSNATITIKQTGISDQTFTLNGSATTITLVDTNTWRPLGTGANDACAGNDSRLSNARPASDVYSWAKASTKPSYTHNEIGAGVLTIGDGANRLMFRTNASYANGIYYSTPGNEALVFATKYSVTSWIFATTDPTQQAAWTGLIPSLQIKNGRVTINKLIAGGTDAAYNLDVNGTLNATTIYENGSTLANTYLGKSAKAADADKLDGQDSTYYLNYNNFTNTPASVLYTSQTLTDAQKTQARTNIGAGTSSFTGYTSSNKLSTNYIQNDAGWSSFSGYSSSNKLHTDYINNAAGWTSVTESTVSGWGFTKNAGTVTQVKVGTTAYNPSSGIVSLPAYPTKSSWNYDDTYIKISGNSAITGDLILNTDANKDLGSASKRWNNIHAVTAYATTFWAKGTNHYTTYGDQTIALGATNAPYAVLTLPSTTGTLALVGDNNHSHTLSIASGGTASINLAANTTYTLTAGGKTYAFKTPASGGGHYANQYNSAYYLSSNSGASLFSEDIQAGNSIVGFNGGTAHTIGIGWPGLEADEAKKTLMFSTNRIDLILTDNYQYYTKGFSIDLYDDDYYSLHIRANGYSDMYGTVSDENGATTYLHTSQFIVEPSNINSAVTNKKHVSLGVVMHNINYTYSSTVLLKMNIRGQAPSESAITSYANLCNLLYQSGHRSAATCLTCSGRYSSYSYIVLGVYATSYNSGLTLVYCAASSNTVNTLSIASGTVTDTLSVSLVP